MINLHDKRDLIAANNRIIELERALIQLVESVENSGQRLQYFKAAMKLARAALKETWFVDRGQ